MKKLIAIFTVLLLLFTLNASDLITLSGFLSPLSSYSFSDTDSERIEEIAHMLSGATLTDAALNNARALLHASR